MTTLLVDGNKVCRLCGESKSLTDFGSRPANRDGRDGTCLACAAAVGLTVLPTLSAIERTIVGTMPGTSGRPRTTTSRSCTA